MNPAFQVVHHAIHLQDLALVAMQVFSQIITYVMLVKEALSAQEEYKYVKYVQYNAMGVTQQMEVAYAS